MKKKVLFLITKSNWGGAQRYVYDLATGLDRNQFEPVVALGGDGELKQKLAAQGIQTVTLSSLQRDISITKEMRFAWELYKLLRNERPTVLHVNSSKAGGMGCFVGRLALTPLIVFTAHGWAFNERRPNWQKVVIKFFHWLTVLLSHKTIAVSHETKRQLNWPLPKNRWSVIHNGRRKINFLSREQAREALRLTDRLTTGTIAELHPVKQHDLMIRAVALLKARGYPLQHVIIGAGKVEKDLKALVKKLNVSEHVMFTGALDEAARYLKAFDIYVQPSRSEAFCFTVVEAAQAGLPIIASRVGGIPEIITDQENGLLVPNDNVETLCTALIDLIEHTKHRETLAMAALETSKHFSFTRMLQRTTALYDSNTTSSAKADSRATD